MKSLVVLIMVTAATVAAADMVKSLAGEWRVTGRGLSGGVRLPGTLADARLGRHMTAGDWRKDTDRQSKGALTREYQYVGTAVYEREIVLTEEESRYPLELVMERVMLRSELVIDGVEIGSCDSLATEHVYPIPQKLTKAGRHVIRLALDNSNRYNFGESAHSYGPVMQSIWHGVVGKFLLRRQSPLRKVRVFATWPAQRKLSVEVPEGFDAKKENVQLARWMDAERMHLPHVHDINGPDGRCPDIVSFRHKGPSPYRKGFDLVELELDREPEAWSEHHPNLYTLTLREEAADFTYAVRFGFRSVEARDRAIWINGNKWFMRGNLDCCHFPLTGAPDTVKAWWRETFRKLRDEDGINSIRFHSWTPPKAAFEAADEMGMCFAVEAGIWEWNKIGHGKPIDAFVQRELRSILEMRGNAPCFISLGIGNEIGGTDDYTVMSKWIDECKRYDPRRLYIASTSRYDAHGRHMRECAADDYYSAGGIGRHKLQFHPFTNWDYDEAYADIALPFVAHEIGQWPIYVDWKHELPRYTGVLRPYNLEHFRDVAVRARTERFWPRFCEVSANLNRLMYKDQVEALMRTPSCAGLQLLSAQDFTGQFEAMIGWRDSFYDLKPSVKRLAPFKNVFNSVPHLARFEKYTWSVGETYRATLVVRNITEEPIIEGTEFACGKTRSAPYSQDDSSG